MKETNVVDKNLKPLWCKSCDFVWINPNNFKWWYTTSDILFVYWQIVILAISKFRNYNFCENKRGFIINRNTNLYIWRTLKTKGGHPRIETTGDEGPKLCLREGVKYLLRRSDGEEEGEDECTYVDGSGQEMKIVKQLLKKIVKQSSSSDCLPVMIGTNFVVWLHLLSSDDRQIFVRSVLEKPSQSFRWKCIWVDGKYWRKWQSLLDDTPAFISSHIKR